MQKTYLTNNTKAPLPQEKILVDLDAENICCDGGGPLGHPKVWYSFENKTSIECSYCDRIFIKE